MTGGRQLTFGDACAVLCNEPFCLTAAEVGTLTPAQVRLLYFRERDEYGRIAFPKPKGKRGTVADLERKRFYAYWRQTGLRADLIDTLWKELRGQ